MPVITAFTKKRVGLQGGGEHDCEQGCCEGRGREARSLQLQERHIHPGGSAVGRKLAVRLRWQQGRDALIGRRRMRAHAIFREGRDGCAAASIVEARRVHRFAGGVRHGSQLSSVTT